MRTASLLLAAAVAASLAAPPAHAQAWKRLANRAKDKVEQKVGEKQDRAIDQAMGGTAVAPPADAPPGTAASSPASASGSSTSAAPLKPGEGAWANYDFVPGERALFVDDFSSDRVGNFPRRLEFAEGNMEVVDWQGRRFLRATAASAFRIPLPESLPERFTIEFDVYKEGASQSEWIAVMTSAEALEDSPMNYHGFPGSYFLIENGTVRMEGQGPATHTDTKRIGEEIVPVRIAVDGAYAKMYMGEQRVINIPNAKVVRGDKVHVIVWWGSPEFPAYIGDIRVMAGGRELYDALAAEGRVATQGILFDTGSDRIRPESTPTLAEIGAMLKGHPELRLGIEGHTDDVGDAAANQALSERRAAAVTAFLAAEYGIAADRLAASGHGESAPVAANDTAEGRQQNRRVELVRL